MKKAFVYIYLLWVSINIMVLAYAMANPHMSYGIGEVLVGHKDTSAFFPFESVDIGNYDFSEFIVYTIAIPLCLFAMIKLYRLFVPLKTSN